MPPHYFQMHAVWTRSIVARDTVVTAPHVTRVTSTPYLSAGTAHPDQKQLPDGFFPVA